MRVKICGITTSEQGKAIADLGATALGFICVAKSPRYVTVGKIQEIVAQLPDTVDRVAVFANAPFEAIADVLSQVSLTAIQLHGDESPQLCDRLRQHFPTLEVIKALRIQSVESLTVIKTYSDVVDTFLLDAYDPNLLGGTGKTLNWSLLQSFAPPRPWLLAGGLTPDNIVEALQQVKPHGIDLSSGVERSPGHKDLTKVAQLFEQLRQF